MLLIMKRLSLYLLCSLAIFSYYVNCEQLSTVFVLETSDSANDPHSVAEQASASRESKVIDDTSTKIITDSSSSNGSNGRLQQQQQNKQVDNKTSATRRLEEERLLQQQQNQKPVRSLAANQQVANANTRTRSSTTTTQSSVYDREESNSNAQYSTPKTEERLLISITSEGHDEDEYKPPKKNTLSTGNLGGAGELNLGQLQPQQQQPQQQKRKPSITISIQDSNLGKHDGSPSAVIVRPSENGQSIVISTIGNSNINKHPQGNKPAYVTQPSPDPYRDPVENHNQNNNYHQIHTSTSTYRPALINNDYNPPANINTNNNRPAVTSTLVDQPSRPIHVNDERPNRPTQTQSDENNGYSPQSDSNQRPTTSRPVNRPSTSINQDLTPSGGFSSGSEQQDEISRPTSGESKFPLNEKNCGLVHETRIVGGEEANPDDFLWMAAIIKSKPVDGEARPFCGGSLITRRHILTAAHCLENLAPRDVLVRLGSYDFDDSTASSLSADYAIDQFRVPAHYSKKTHVADIAIMRLKTPLSTNDNYKTVCMPQARRSYVGALGTVTGYGSQSQTFRRAAPKLRQVTVPIWENRKCSVVYKKNLTDSYLCAGYEEGGKDACQGDSGGPLMTEGPNERMMVVGVVSHGIGCGSPGYPGVYTRTTTYLDWIEKNTKE